MKWRNPLSATAAALILSVSISQAVAGVPVPVPVVAVGTSSAGVAVTAVGIGMVASVMLRAAIVGQTQCRQLTQQEAMEGLFLPFFWVALDQGRSPTSACRR